MRLLQARNIQVRLDLVGAGPDTKNPCSIFYVGVQERVQMRGPQYGADKKRVLEESDVLVIPTYEEGLPYILLESMAAGTVPVTCPVGGIPESLASASAASSCRHETHPRWRRPCTGCIVIVRWRVH